MIFLAFFSQLFSTATLFPALHAPVFHPFPAPSGPPVLMSFLCISYVVFMFKT